MRRSALALGATVFALALTAGPAAAEPGASQAVDDSIGSAQVGAVGIDAPVRVLSDGDSATTGASAGGPQTTGDSTGAAQVTSVDANTPVRVLSDGDDASDAPSGTTAPEQSTADSSGSAQVGSPTASAPVRVLSDGDGGTPTPGDEPDTPDTGDVAADLLDTLLGSPSEGGGDLVALPSQTAPADGAGDSPSPGALRRLVDGSDPRPAVRFISGGTSAASSPDQVQTLDVSAAGLPLTGFGLLQTMAMGLWLLSSGLALRLVPGGRRR